MGKTTLLRTIIGLNNASKGDIVFDADDITHVPTYKRAVPPCFLAKYGFVSAKVSPTNLLSQNTIPHLADAQSNFEKNGIITCPPLKNGSKT